MLRIKIVIVFIIYVAAWFILGAVIDKIMEVLKKWEKQKNKKLLI